MPFDKLNVSPIVREHAATLVDAATGGKTADRLLHFGLPALVFGWCFWGGIRLSEDAVQLAVTCLAVVVSLLFNLLVVASSLRMANRGSVIFGDAKRLSRQILVNVEYAILVALAAIAVVMPTLLPAPTSPRWLVSTNSFAQEAVGPLFVALLVSFFLSLLMVLKRMHVALTKNLELTYDSAPEVGPRLLRDRERSVG